MPESSRNLLLRNRPIRHAHLVDLDAWKAEDPVTVSLVEKIVTRAQLSWHGLHTPIVFHHGDQFSDSDWALLRYADFDHLHASSALSETLVERIADELAPIHLKVARVREGEAHFEIAGTSLPLVPELLKSHGDRPLLVFDLAKDCDPIVQRFLKWNFGAFDQWVDSRHPDVVRRLHGVEQFLEKVTTKRFPISDRASLVAFLNAAAGSRPARGTPYVHPLSFTAICELGGTGDRFAWLRGAISRQYLVHVGDTPQDFTAHWNMAWLSGNVGVPYERQLWLPAALARDPGLHDALNNWFRHVSGWGGNDQRWLTFASQSLSPGELKTVAEAICQRPGSPLPIHLQTPEEVTRDRNQVQADLDHNPPMRGNEADVYRRVIHGATGIVDVPSPTPFGVSHVSGTWMVDVQVQHVADSDRVDDVRPWLLPARAGSLAQHIFKAPARMNRARLFSVEVGRNSGGFRGATRPELRLQLPAEGDVVRWFLTCERPYWNNDDPRSKLKRQSILGTVQPSQNGRLTQGLLGLFGSLGTAHHFLSRPFWQKLFRELTALDPKRDQNLVNQTSNLLAKELRQLNPPSHVLERAARKLAGTLSGRALGQYRTLRQCERLRLELAKTEQGQGQFAAGQSQLFVIKFGGFSREDMLREFDSLVKRNILRLGGALTCRRCGVRHWHNLRDLDQTVSCPGCDNRLTIPIDLQWSVELNGLARAAVAQGVLGVIQALSGVGTHAKSFFWGPSYELFRPDEKKPWHEVDVVAIVDGELILGEVKEGHVGVKDFDSLVEMAEALRPAKALFFINQAEWREELQTAFDLAKARLAAVGIALELHHLVIL